MIIFGFYAIYQGIKFRMIMKIWSYNSEEIGLLKKIKINFDKTRDFTFFISIMITIGLIFKLSYYVSNPQTYGQTYASIAGEYILFQFPYLLWSNSNVLLTLFWMQTTQCLTHIRQEGFYYGKIFTKFLPIFFIINLIICIGTSLLDAFVLVYPNIVTFNIYGAIVIIFMAVIQLIGSYKFVKTVKEISTDVGKNKSTILFSRRIMNCCIGMTISLILAVIEILFFNFIVDFNQDPILYIIYSDLTDILIFIALIFQFIVVIRKVNNDNSESKSTESGSEGKNNSGGTNNSEGNNSKHLSEIAISSINNPSETNPNEFIPMENINV